MKKKRIPVLLLCILMLCANVAAAELPACQTPSPAYEWQLYSEGPDIQIEYPAFTGDGMEALNALVLDKAQSLAKSVDDELIINYAKYHCAVTLLNAKVASVVFWGESNVENSAHPFSDLLALTVELPSLRELKLTELYAVNEDFERVFFEKAFFPTNPVTSYDEASFAEMLALQTPEYQMVSPFTSPESVACFLKPDGIVLSLPAVHATGSDHFEAQLRYEDVQPFYLLSQALWAD